MITFLVIMSISVFLLAVVLPAKIKQRIDKSMARRRAIALLDSISKEEYTSDPSSFFSAHHSSLGPISYNDFVKLAARKGWN